MLDFLKKMFSGVIKAGVFAGMRMAAVAAGPVILTWLAAHHVSSDFATRLVGDLQDMLLTLTGIGLTAAGIGATVKDVNKVATKMRTSADAGAAVVQQAVRQAQLQGEDVQAAADQGRADAVKTAITVADTKAKNATVDDVLAKMRAGGA